MEKNDQTGEELKVDEAAAKEPDEPQPGTSSSEASSSSTSEVGFYRRRMSYAGAADSVSQSRFDPTAPPFCPASSSSSIGTPSPPIADYPIVNVGPSQVPVNANIWHHIAHPSVLPTLPYMLPGQGSYGFNPQPFMHYNAMPSMSVTPVWPDNTPSPNEPVCNYGPLATPDGIVELRLREGIKVFLTLDRSILLVNARSMIRIALSRDMKNAAVEHPNGKVFQQYERVDIMCYDGARNNQFVRYAKMWQKGVSLTADNLALIYLVDNAGTRTTSDALNRDYNADYCTQVFLYDCRAGAFYRKLAEAVAKNFHFVVQDDGTEVFHMHGFTIAQMPDGMVRINRSRENCAIRTSPMNGSATLSTPDLHCTASINATSHMFVRRDERRMHFDGTSFVVRNAGHSAGFDDRNFLRVY